MSAGESYSTSLSPDEIRRYSRHLVMPEVGTEGQEKLKSAKVLVIGAGGLGSPVGLYLAAAGVGRIGLVDFDRVEESNLQRQVLYGHADVGRAKIGAAAERLREVNPLIEVATHEIRLDSANALDLIQGYDIVVDGSDNFPTRYLVNDACVLAGKPDVYGSIFRFEGQVAVFWGAHGPCYRCLFPEPPAPGQVPSCAEGGVLGVLPGIIGSLQAMEALKLALGIGDPLVGRLVLFEGLSFKVRELELEKRPDCPVCSEHPTVTELIDYDRFCGFDTAERDAGDGPVAEAEDPGIDVSPRLVSEWIESGRDFDLLDVRTPLEARVCRLEGAPLMPLQELPRRFPELDPAREVVVYCHHGNRSAHAVAFLRRQGFERARNLAGGLDAWSLTVDPTMPRY